MRGLQWVKGTFGTANFSNTQLVAAPGAGKFICFYTASVLGLSAPSAYHYGYLNDGATILGIGWNFPTDGDAGSWQWHDYHGYPCSTNVALGWSAFGGAAQLRINVGYRILTEDPG